MQVASAPDSGMTVQPVTLHGTHVSLEPLEHRHAPALLDVGRDERIWTHLTREPFVDLDDVHAWIDQALSAQQAGTQLAWAIVHRPTRRVAGSTRYLNVSPADRGLEIGWTWLGIDYQRTAVNTECKLLLLGHAFDQLGCVRVQLKTDALNLRSRTAIERLGAVFEGVLRSYQRTRGDRIRDTAMYSILHHEWPAVRTKLLEALADRNC